jgi:hypothetical protein
VHPLEIHSYVPRSYRDPESLEDVWIKIPVRSCSEAKSLGRQHTKRLLPDFLIPFARMRLDTVVEAGHVKERGSSLEECCRIIGCTDLRTARVHLARLTKVAQAVALTLAERQADAVHLHEHTYQLQPRAPLERLAELCARQEEVQLRSGRADLHPRGLRRLLQAALWKNRRKVLTSYVSRAPPQS